MSDTKKRKIINHFEVAKEFANENAGILCRACVRRGKESTTTDDPALFTSLYDGAYSAIASRNRV